MTEAEARDWIAARFGNTAIDRLAILVDMVEAEAVRQNLVSMATLPSIWARHVVDSAQLLELAGDVAGPWLDIGTGAGFPGLVIGALGERETMLIEPRRRRIEFLQAVVDRLGIGHKVYLRQARAEKVAANAGVISARAVASVEKVLTSAANCATMHTRWLLPKGRHAAEEVATAKRSWRGLFHVEQSITDPASMIVVANRVYRR